MGAVVLINLFFVPLHLAGFAFQDALLVPRNRVVLRAFRCAVIVLVLVLDDRYVNPTSVVSIALSAGVMTVVCFSDPPRERLLVGGLLVVAATCAEMCGTSAWLMLAPGHPTSSYLSSWQHFPAHVLGMTVAFAIEGAYLLVMAHLCRRLRQEGRRAQADKDVPLVLAASPAVQALAMAGLATGAMLTDATRPLPLFVASAVCGLCALSNIAVFGAAGSLRQRRRAMQEERALQRELDHMLDLAELEMAQAQERARLRHNVRSHLHVLSGLVERGSSARAAAYARALAQRLTEVRTKAGGSHAS